MQIHSLVQGSTEWKAYRRDHFNASDAPAMMGCSPYKTRAELLRELHSGIAADVDEATQIRFDAGHRFEALARPLAEKIIGQELYPVTGSNGRLSASFDGITMDERVVFEHKSANAELRAFLSDAGATGAGLPLHYRVQMEQQLMVSGAERALFMATLWDGDACTYSGHVWYEPDAELRAAILQGWDQFERDLATYTPPAKADPAPTGRAPDSLPALRIEVTGQVTASNLAEFKQTALAAIGSVNRNLQTDQDFADAEKAVKWCSEAEARLAAAKQHALSQTASIDELFRTMDEISAEARRVRLDLEKLVKARKEAIRGDIVTDARMAWREHVGTLQGEIEGVTLGLSEPDFAGAIKGKRTIDSLRDATDTLLAQAKIAANEKAAQIRAALAVLREESAGFEFLFRDRATLALKPAEDVRQLARARITEHRAAEEKRLEAERERIRIEEQARAQVEAMQKQMAAQNAPVVEQARIDALITGTGGFTAHPDGSVTLIVHPDDSKVMMSALLGPAPTDDEAPSDAPLIRGEIGVIDASITIIEPTKGDQPRFERGHEGMEPEACESAAGRGADGAPALAMLPQHSSPGVGPMGTGQPADAGPAGGKTDTRPPLDSFETAPWVMPRADAIAAVTAAIAAADEKPTVKLGDICDWLGFAVRADFLADVLHIEHRATDKAAKLYFPSDRLAIGRALIAHIGEKLDQLGD